MADVTGNIGDQDVQLNNAATEATLKQLLAAMLAMAASKGLSGKSMQDLEKRLKSLAKQSEKLEKQLTKEEKEHKKRAQEEKARHEKNKKTANALGQAMGMATNTVNKLSSSMMGLLSDLANLGDSLNSAASSLSHIPVVGGALASTFGAVASAAEKTYSAFNKTASVGANFGGSIDEMIGAASAAGMTFDEFSGLLAKNGESLRILGGDTANGAKLLAKFGKEIKNSPVNKELAMMGYTTADINDGLAKYAGIMAKSGRSQADIQSNLVNETGEYLKNLDAVSKLTGKSKEALQQEMDARRQDAQYRVAERKLAPEDRKNLDLMMNSMSKVEQEAFKGALATGTMNEQMQKLNAVNPQLAKSLMDSAIQARQSGKFSKEAAYKLDENLNAAAKAAKNNATMNTLGAYAADQYGDAVIASMDRETRASTLRETTAKNEADALKNAGQTEALKNFKSEVANVSNQFTALLANSGLLTDMMSIFKGLVEFTGTTLVPIFKFLADNSTAVGAVLGTMAVTIGLVNGAMFIYNTVTKMQTLAAALNFPALTALAAGVWAAVAPFAPLILAVAAVGAVLYGLKKAGEWVVDKFNEAGWSFSDILEALGDNLKRWYVTLAEGLMWVLDKVTFGDANKKIKQGQQWLKLQKQELDDKAKARDQRRKEASEKYKQEKAEKESKKENTEETKKNTEAKKEEAKVNKPSVNYADPTSTLKYFRESMKMPGATAAAPSAPAHEGLGGMSAKFESGSRGSGAVGWDSTGGTSYGKYQIATKTGTMNKFMDYLKTSNPEAYAALSAAGPADAGKNGQFAQVWKQLADSGKLGTSEHDFIKKTHYDVGMKGIKNQGLSDMIGKSKALQDVMWSTSVQHGGGGAGGIFNKVYKEGMTEQDLIKAIYSERGTRFGSSSANVQASVKNRFAQEQAMALGMVGQPGAATPSGTQVAQAVTKETAASSASKPSPASGGAVPAPSQESPTTLLSSLNTKMEELIAINRGQLDVGKKQVKVASASSGDMFNAVPMGA